MTTVQDNLASENWLDTLFRLARVLIFALAVVLPWEATTAVRENCLFVGAALLLAYLLLSPGRKLRATALWMPLIAYALCAAISLISAVDVIYSLKEFRSELLKGVLAFYVGVHIINAPQHVMQLWKAVLCGLLIMCAAGVVLFFVMGGSLFDHAVRAGSIHNGYGGLSTYLVTVWPFALFAPLALKEAWARRFMWALYPLVGFTAFITFSRAGWVAMLVETFLMLFVLSKNRRRTAAVSGLVLVLALSGLFLLPGSKHGEKWELLWNDPQKVGGTTGDLLALWSHSYNEVKSHPFSGIGLGRRSFAKAYPDFMEAHHPLLWHAHNMFVDAALQMGVQGLFALIWLMAVLLHQLWPKAPPIRRSAPKVFGAAAWVMVIGFCIRNLTDDFFVDDSALMFWLLAGCALGGLAAIKETESKAA